MKNRLPGVWVMAMLVFSVAHVSDAAELRFVFDTPSDDRWQYPFNFTPGFRATGSCFGAPGIAGFNDRDGAVVVAWETGELVTPGQGAQAYDIRSITVTLTNQANVHVHPEWPIDLTVDEWSTYLPGALDSDPGRPIELFGAGFGPTYDAASWAESSFFVGSTSEADVPRDPFPFGFQDETQDAVHVEDSVKGLHNEGLVAPLCDDPDGVCPFTPIPWAIGVPIDYTPGSQSAPFDVRFEIDLGLSDGAVRRYFQEQLHQGRLSVYVTSLREAALMGPASGFPSFFMLDGVPLDPQAKAASLTVVLATVVTGDLDHDGFVSLSDWSAFVDCLSGPGETPFPPPPLSVEECLCAFDFDTDGDVDFSDGAEFSSRLNQ